MTATLTPCHTCPKVQINGAPGWLRVPYVGEVRHYCPACRWRHEWYRPKAGGKP